MRTLVIVTKLFQRHVKKFHKHNTMQAHGDIASRCLVNKDINIITYLITTVFEK